MSDAMYGLDLLCGPTSVEMCRRIEKIAYLDHSGTRLTKNQTPTTPQHPSNTRESPVKSPIWKTRYYSKKKKCSTHKNNCSGKTENLTPTPTRVNHPPNRPYEERDTLRREKMLKFPLSSLDLSTTTNCTSCSVFKVLPRALAELANSRFLWRCSEL